MKSIFFLSTGVLLILLSLATLVKGEDTSSSPVEKIEHKANTSSNNPVENIPGVNAGVLKGVSTEAAWFGLDSEVTIATRHEMHISKAPSIVTVITSEEIKNLGYRTFVEILRTVPGFEILKTGSLGDTIPAVRGLAGDNKVRLMLNGHLVNNPLRGGAFVNFEDFPVEGIKRIEIIRGPGSAMYGENAFMGVINIITMDATDIDGVKVGSGYGSFGTYDENIVFGKTYGNVAISGMARYRQTDGFDGIVKSDSQSIVDSNLSSRGFSAASQAPDEVEDWRQEYDMNLKVTYKDFYFEGLYINKNAGTFIGPQYALNDESDIQNNYFYGEVGYKKTFDERFSLKPRVFYDQFDRDGYFESLPEGATVSVDSDGDGISDAYETYPEGHIVNSMVIERVLGTEIPFDYELFDGNTLTLGLEYRYINQTNVHFLSNVDPNTQKPLDSIQDFSDSYPQIGKATRDIWSVYLQDMWDITDTLNLILGVRHDEYSDFGGTTNPRSGLTWAFMKNASLKLLYGEAFRAPSFVETHAIYRKNTIIRGNKDLDPETVRSYEAGLSYKFNKYVTSSVNYFFNDIKDLIVLRSAFEDTTRILSYENYGDAHVHGVEFETKVDIAKGNYIFMNYTFQNAENNEGDNLPYVSNHKGNFGVNVHYWKYVNTNLNTFVSGKRFREGGDTRAALPAYALLNLSVIGKEFFKTMEVQGTVYNLLNKDYNDPGPTSIMDDLPRPGRTFFIGLSYQF